MKNKCKAVSYIVSIILSMTLFVVTASTQPQGIYHASLTSGRLDEMELYSTIEFAGDQMFVTVYNTSDGVLYSQIISGLTYFDRNIYSGKYNGKPHFVELQYIENKLDVITIFGDYDFSEFIVNTKKQN